MESDWTTKSNSILVETIFGKIESSLHGSVNFKRSKWQFGY